jgi:hypothetical protein
MRENRSRLILIAAIVASLLLPAPAPAAGTTCPPGYRLDDNDNCVQIPGGTPGVGTGGSVCSGHCPNFHDQQIETCYNYAAALDFQSCSTGFGYLLNPICWGLAGEWSSNGCDELACAVGEHSRDCHTGVVTLWSYNKCNG